MSVLGQLLPNAYQQFFNLTTGLPLAGGQLFSYQAGTTTAQATYTDATLATPNSNPVVLNSAGSANIWLNPALGYKFVMKDSSNNVLWTVDNVWVVSPGSIDKTKLASNVAGAALLQNGTGSIDVQVDGVTIDINSSNDLEVKPGAITADFLPTSSKLEVLTRYSRDFGNTGTFEQIPQYEWSAPSLTAGPVTLPPGVASRARWSPSGEFLAVSNFTSPFIDIYQRSGSYLYKLPDPSTVPVSPCIDIAWSPCGSFLILGLEPSSHNPTNMIYQRVDNVFTQITFSGPSGANPIQGYSVAFSPSSDFVSVGFVSATANGVKIYSRSGTVFTDVTSGSGISSNAFLIGKWSPDSQIFMSTDITTGFPLAYTQALGVFTGITAPNLTTYATSINAIEFSPDRKYVAFAIAVSPWIVVFSIDPVLNTFSKIADPATLPVGAIADLSWSLNGEYLAIAVGVTPFVEVYKMVSNALVKQSDPATVPGGALNGVSFSPTKQFLACATTVTPYIQVYETSSTLQSDALLWTRGVPNV